jgi:hypothetical protein
VPYDAPRSGGGEAGGEEERAHAPEDCNRGATPK